MTAGNEGLPGGLAGSARRLGSSLVGLLQTRLELLAVELQEEKIRILDLLAWLTTIIALAVAAILLGIGMLALYLWQQAGFLGLAGLALLTGGAALALFLALRRRLARGPAPFSATAAEFRRDVEWIRRND
ncbi:MAG TPA: phage holin family protein [Lacunisphaera sp.]|nr:phage holin family protein [Lacunisphaera sp.]